MTIKIKDPQVLESCANDVVDCIRQVMDVLRSEFPTTATVTTIIHASNPIPPPLYTKMVERGIFQRVQEILRRQQEVLLLPGDHNQNVILPDTTEDEKDWERSQLVFHILRPLLQCLTRCYEQLDQLPQPPPPELHKQKNNNKKNKPAPPIGMLSIQNYTDIACLLEFTVCTSLLFHLEPHVLTCVQDRIKYQMPKSLAGRLPRNSCLAWAKSPSLQVLLEKVQQDEDDSKVEEEELVHTARTISNLVLLERFCPMLLPRHIADIYAALFQAEHNLKGTKGVDELPKALPRLYQRLGLMTSSTPPSASDCIVIDATLQAKAYQTLLLQGIQAPSWLRQRVSPLLNQLACHNLPAIVQVFVPLQGKESASASQRLGRALATTHDDRTTTALTRQMLGLLQILFPTLCQGNIPARAMAILQTIWAVLDHSEAVRKQLIKCWIQDMASTTKSTNGQCAVLHATIRQIGSLCAWVPPSSTTSTLPIILQQSLFASDTFLFGQLVRVASMPSIVVSTARQDARQTLQWLALALCSTSITSKQQHFPAITKGDILVTGSSLLVAAWIHALAPSSWDLSGHKYAVSSSLSGQSSSLKKKSSAVALEQVYIQQGTNRLVDISSLVEDTTKRVEVLVEASLVFSMNDAVGENSKTGQNAPSHNLNGLPSQLFRLLLQLYLSSSTVQTNDMSLPASKSLGDDYRLVAIILLPLLCEKCPPENLLFGDSQGDAIDLLKLVKLVLACARSRILYEADSEVNPADIETNDHGSLTDDGQMILWLEQMRFKLAGNGKKTPPLRIADDGDVQNETLLSIASIVLSLLIAVLELGIKLRSKGEEAMLKSFLPILQPLAEFCDHAATDMTPSQESEAGMADMSSYAMALIASRQSPYMEDGPAKSPAPLSTMDKLRKLILEAEEDLKSTQPPMRARGMVSLGRLARGYLGIIPKEKAVLVMELKNPSSSKEDDPVAFLIQEILRLSVIALSDAESYVYLAAIQTVVAIGDMRPHDVLPIVASAVVSGTLKTRNALLSSAPESDIRLSQEQRIKLAEALMFTIRRRAAPDEFVSMLVNLMIFGSMERIGSKTDSETGEEKQQLIQEETRRYFTRVDKKEEIEQETREEKWEEQDIRLKTGGPVFAMEEADVGRSTRVSVLAELVSVSKPSAIAPHCRLLVRLVVDVLRLDSSRTVCRAASLLARELYGCLLREQEELARSVNDSKNENMTPLPLAVALISSDEDLLLVVLQSHALLTGDESERRVKDPATTVRCRESLSLREQADTAGIISAARLIHSQSELNHVPDILTSIAKKSFGIVEINKLDAMG